MRCQLGHGSGLPMEGWRPCQSYLCKVYSLYDEWYTPAIALTKPCTVVPTNTGTQVDMCSASSLQLLTQFRYNACTLLRRPAC